VPTYAIDSTAQALRATGIVEPAFAWVEDPTTGRRTQSKAQETAEDGRPVWNVEVTYLSEAFGRQSTVVSKVTVPAAHQPVVSAFDLVGFEGLSVSVSVAKGTNQTREFWRADGLTPARKAQAAA
jgi:hypothetical protein